MHATSSNPLYRITLTRVDARVGDDVVLSHRTQQLIVEAVSADALPPARRRHALGDAFEPLLDQAMVHAELTRMPLPRAFPTEAGNGLIIVSAARPLA